MPCFRPSVCIQQFMCGLKMWSWGNIHWSNADNVQRIVRVQWARWGVVKTLTMTLPRASSLVSYMCSAQGELNLTSAWQCLACMWVNLFPATAAFCIAKLPAVPACFPMLGME